MDVTAIGAEYPDGTVKFRCAGIAEGLAPQGMPLTETISRLERRWPDSASARQLVHAAYARTPVATAGGIVEYVNVAGANPRCRFALLMCDEGWVGWEPRHEPQRARRALIVGRIEAVVRELEMATDALDTARDDKSNAALGARAWSHEAAIRNSRSVRDILGIDEPGSMYAWHRLRLTDVVRTLHRAALPERPPRTRRVDFENALQEIGAALDAAREGLNQMTTRSLWLPGSAVWPERGQEILVALDRVAEAVTGSQQETRGAQDILALIERVPARRARGYRGEAREHGRRATETLSAAQECLERVRVVETGLGDELSNLKHHNAMVAWHRTLKTMTRSVNQSLASGERLFDHLRIARRSAMIAFRATTERHASDDDAANAALTRTA